MSSTLLGPPILTNDMLLHPDFLKDNGILSGSHLKPPPPLPSAPIAHNQPLPQVAPSPTPLDIPSSSEQVTPRQYAPLGDIEMKTPSRALFDLDALLAAPSVLFGSSSMSQSSTDMEIFTLPVLPFNRTITPIPIASPSLSQTISPFTTPLMPTVSAFCKGLDMQKSFTKLFPGYCLTC